MRARDQLIDGLIEDGVMFGGRASNEERSTLLYGLGEERGALLEGRGLRRIVVQQHVRADGARQSPRLCLVEHRSVVAESVE